MKNYYSILQVAQDAEAEVIQMAYKALAKKYHPDLHVEASDELMKEINEAYAVLSDAEKRKKYDYLLKNNINAEDNAKSSDSDCYDTGQDKSSQGESNQDESNQDKSSQDENNQDKSSQDENDKNERKSEDNISNATNKKKPFFLTWWFIVISFFVFPPAFCILLVCRFLYIIKTNHSTSTTNKSAKRTGVIVLATLLILAFIGSMTQSNEVDKQDAEEIAKDQGEMESIEKGTAQNIIEVSEKNEEQEIIEEQETIEEQEMTEEQEVMEEQNVMEESQIEQVVDTPAVPLTYEWEQFESMLTQYERTINPYYQDGIERYVAMVNTYYSLISTPANEQTIKATTLENAMKDAGVSSSLIKDINAVNFLDIMKSENIYRLDVNKKSGVLEILFEGDTQRLYLEVSNSAKDQIAQNEEVHFYYGDLKDNYPNGDGFLFNYNKTDGVRLVYAGKFNQGQFDGKGIRFIHDDYGYTILESGEYKENVLNGNGIKYSESDCGIVYNLYKEKFIEYFDNYYSTYNEEEQKICFQKIIINNPAVELALVRGGYETNSMVNMNEAVLVPYYTYIGKIKNGSDYDGTGKLYTPGGALLYSGKWSNGKYDGKGTIYNGDGSVRKTGEFSKEEINKADTYMSLSRNLIGAFREMDVKGVFGEDLVIE